MISVYPACFFKEETGYSVIFPDLNWLATCGTTESDAMAMAIDCLAGYLYSQKIDGEQVATPSAMNDISLNHVASGLDSDYKEGFVSMVAVDVDEYAKEHFEKTVRKTLSIPAWLNKAATEKHINFSQTLKEALIAKVRSY